MRNIKGYVTSDERICFGILYYDSEEAAQEAAKQTIAEGNTYNGGMFHGMACGRDKSWDHTSPEGIRLYAVTH
jgi:hypothetical protein